MYLFKCIVCVCVWIIYIKINCVFLLIFVHYCIKISRRSLILLDRRPQSWFQNTWTKTSLVMDVMPTLDVVDGLYEEEEDSAEDDEGVWGRLFPLRKEFVPLSKFSMQ